MTSGQEDKTPKTDISKVKYFRCGHSGFMKRYCKVQAGKRDASYYALKIALIIETGPFII